MISHQAVLLTETIEHLAPAPGGVFVDVTCGAGGHTERLAEAVGEGGLVLAVDQDLAALAIARERLGNIKQIRFIHDNFRRLDRVLDAQGIAQVNGILADLGISSMQMDDVDRGFAFASESELDMRMDPTVETPASVLLSRLSEKELGVIFRDYGEEHKWRRMARAVVRHRGQGGRFTGPDLQRLAHKVLGSPRSGNIDSATRVFQALRIAVNDELGALEQFLPAATSALAPGGRLAVISFHSLEDRMVKHFFREQARGCVCPKEIPHCVCGRTPTLRVLTGKPVRPTDREEKENPRSRSARLRVAEKIASVETGEDA